VSASKRPATTVRVTVGDEEHVLRTDASPAHARAVAEFVDQAMRGIRGAAPTLEPYKVAVLAALQVADELLRERAAHVELVSDMWALSDEIRPLLPPAKRQSGGHGAV
jgi:cell division protein ZapA